MFPRTLPKSLEGFEVQARLGAGGAGEVYLARSRGGKLVAIKVLNEDVRHDQEVRDALAVEARLCSRLNHEAIVQLRAYIDRPDVAALVLEYVDGVALERLLRFTEKRGTRLPDLAAWHVLERVLAALTFAHSHKEEGGRAMPIVHRDVSPSNVLLGWNGTVKLTDFGLAKVLGVASTTRLGLVKGTLGCMAPEQARGERVTERVDVYAAALIGWRLATGRAPFARFQNDEVEMLRAMRHPKLDPLSVMRPDCPPALHAAFAAALEPNPDLRTITAEELRAAVRASFDLRLGASELERLLAKWRVSLGPAPGAFDLSPPRSSGERKDSGPTQRYDDVAASLDLPRAAMESLDDLDAEDIKTNAYIRAAVMPVVPALPPVRVDTAPAFTPVAPGPRAPRAPVSPPPPSAPIRSAPPSAPHLGAAPSAPHLGAAPSGPMRSAPPSAPHLGAAPSAPMRSAPHLGAAPAAGGKGAGRAHRAPAAPESGAEASRAALRRPEVWLLGVAVFFAIVALVAAIVWALG